MPLEDKKWSSPRNYFGSSWEGYYCIVSEVSVFSARWDDIPDCEKITESLREKISW